MADIHYFPAPASGVTIGTGITTVGAANAAGSSTNASADDHVHRGALESGSYAAPAALQAAGVLQQTYSAPTATLTLATLPAGRVPAGAAAGTGVFRTNNLLYYEDDANGPRLNLGFDATWTADTNIGAGVLVYCTNAATVAVLRLQGRDTSQIQGYQGQSGVDELPVATLGFQDGQDGSSSGALQITARRSTGGGGDLIDCIRCEGGGVVVAGALVVGSTGVPEAYAGQSFFQGQEHGTPDVAPGGTYRTRYRTVGGSGNDWPQISVDGGGYAEMARAGQGTAAASGSTLTLPSNGTLIHVTGTTTINYITINRHPPGQPIWLYFESGTITLANNTGSVPGGAWSLQLSTGANTDFAAAATVCIVRDASLTRWLQLKSG